MKRIGIITFHHTVNYGGILQTYALQNLLKEWGHSVENINYFNQRSFTNNFKFKRRIVQFVWQNTLQKILGGQLRKKKTDKFREENISLSSKYNSLESLSRNPPEYDVYISGSDQVWNPFITGNDPAYLLDFVPSGKVKASYAASFGVSALPEKYKSNYAKSLDTFNYISVRETKAKDILSLIVDKDLKVVLDPTLLIDKTKWESLLGAEVKPSKEEYILVYSMPGDKDVNNALRQISRILSDKTRLKVVNIGKKEFHKFKIWENNLTTTGPKDFINLFKNASYIVTNSFHGTAFSIIFEKEFYVPENHDLVGDKHLSSRISSLLSLLNLEDRLIPINNKGDDYKIAINDSIDYEMVKNLLEKEKENSFRFLNELLH